MSATLAELAIRCNAELRGDPTFQIDRVATLETAGPRDIAFVAGEKYSAQLARTMAGAVILAAKDANRFSGNVLLNNNPRLCLAKVAALLHPPAPIRAGRHATAIIDA